MAGRQRPADTEAGPQAAYGGHGLGGVSTPSAFCTFGGLRPQAMPMRTPMLSMGSGSKRDRDH